MFAVSGTSDLVGWLKLLPPFFLLLTACDIQEMLTTPIALAKLGWFLMDARQHQSGRHKDVIMISPPDQGTMLWGSGL